MGIIWHLCRGVIGLFPATMTLVPVEERISVVKYRYFDHDFVDTSYVKMKRGRYKGDIGWLKSVDTSRVYRVLVIPRIDLVPTNKRKASKVNQRPAAKIRSQFEIRQVYGNDSVTEVETGFIFHKRRFNHSGLEVISVDADSVVDVIPETQEIRALLDNVPKMDNPLDYTIKHPIFANIGD